MSTFKVRIAVEVASGMGAPTELAWSYTHPTGDNPRFYGWDLKEAIEHAAQEVVGNVVEAYVRKADAR